MTQILQCQHFRKLSLQVVSVTRASGSHHQKLLYHYVRLPTYLSCTFLVGTVEVGLAAKCLHSHVMSRLPWNGGSLE